MGERLMLVVCLLTCGREELTRRTVESFAQLNAGRQNMRLLHIDVGSEGNGNVEIANSAGFETIFKTSDRPGQMETLRMFAETVSNGDWVLWLENDWESVAPVPEDETLHYFDGRRIQTIRLYAERKMRGDGPRSLAGKHRMGTKEPIDWQNNAWFPGWQIGRAHWGGGGCILIGHAFRDCAAHDRLKDFMLIERYLRSARPKENIMFHIGEETTPGFRD